MNRHQRRLELRIQSLTVRGSEPEESERIAREIEKDEEEDSDSGERGDHVGNEAAIPVPVLEDDDGGEDREQQDPEEQRSGVSPPEGRHLEQDGHGAARVGSDILDIEPVLQKK